MDNLEPFEKRLKEATLDPKTAIEIAGELAINYLGPAHEKADDLRVEVAKAKVKLQDENPEMSATQVKMRVEATELYREYLRAEHWTERLEEFIRIAKHHSKISGNY